VSQRVIREVSHRVRRIAVRGLPRSLWLSSQRAFVAWLDHEPARRGAALAFYSLVSMAPLLLVVLAIGSLVWGKQALRGELDGQLRGLFGDATASAVQSMVQNVTLTEGGGMGLLIGVLVTLFGATTVLAELQASVDELWFRHGQQGVAADAPWYGLVRARLRALAMIGGLAFLLLVSMALSAMLAVVQAAWSAWLGDSSWATATAWLQQLASLLLTTAVFALVYRVLPRQRLRRMDMWVGALVTALLFAVGKSLIGWYLATTAGASVYGAAAALVLVMLWVYWSAQVFLLGAAFTWAWSTRQSADVAR
jgi:membrane protein